MKEKHKKGTASYHGAISFMSASWGSPRPSRAESYTLSNMFYDSDAATGQLYPGFTVTPPPGP